MANSCCCCCCCVAPVVSDSVRPQRRQPTRLPRPWDSPGKNPGVGCHFLLQQMHEKILNITNCQGNTSQNHNSARRKKEILPFVTTWMDLEDIMLSEISQTQKD